MPLEDFIITMFCWVEEHQGFEGGQELSDCGSVGLVAQRQQAGHGYMRSAGIVGPLHGRLLGSTRMLAVLAQLDVPGRAATLLRNASISGAPISRG
jgi:hypothetical protein